LKEEVIDTVGLYHTFFREMDSLRKMVAEGHYDGMPNYDELPQSPEWLTPCIQKPSSSPGYAIYARAKGIKRSDVR
jgi:hypothetical protein